MYDWIRVRTRYELAGGIVILLVLDEDGSIMPRDRLQGQGHLDH